MVEKVNQSNQLMLKILLMHNSIKIVIKRGKFTPHKDNPHINDVEDCIYIASSLQALNVYTWTTIKNNDETGLHLNLQCCIAD